ncbi:hypothetical protein DFH06DRAFT_1145320 [Mycena polygramma]|nr:hypothetical protein DFH06DRAFT_1145320 [Mycena polygramma]
MIASGNVCRESLVERLAKLSITRPSVSGDSEERAGGDDGRKERGAGGFWVQEKNSHNEIATFVLDGESPSYIKFNYRRITIPLFRIQRSKHALSTQGPRSPSHQRRSFRLQQTGHRGPRNLYVSQQNSRKSQKAARPRPGKNYDRVISVRVGPTVMRVVAGSAVGLVNTGKTMRRELPINRVVVLSQKKGKPSCTTVTIPARIVDAPTVEKVGNTHDQG